MPNGYYSLEDSWLWTGQVPWPQTLYLKTMVIDSFSKIAHQASYVWKSDDLVVSALADGSGVHVRVLAGGIVLCYGAKHTSFSHSPSPSLCVN